MAFEKEIQDLKRKWEELKRKELVEAQHEKGKLSARERIDLLLDPDTFQEIDPFVETRHFEFGLFRKKMPGDGVVAGFGKIQGRKVFVFSQDFSVMGGSLGENHAKKIVKVYQLAQKTGCPIIGILDSGGARIQEGIFSLEGYGAIFREQIRASGVIPQIVILAGPCAGGAAYSLALADFVFMIEGISFAFITGPEVIKKVTGEEIDFENLGGSDVQQRLAGNCHFSFSSELDCILAVKKLLSFLPQNHLEDPPFQKAFLAEIFETKENPRLKEMIPEEKTKPYEMRDVINEIFDKDSLFEIQKNFAPNVICALARLFGRVIGIVANQPKVLAGVLDINASDKIARFVRFCDCFNIPLVTLVDCPGYLPGKDQEHGGIIRHGAKVLFAFSEAQVPKISLILRKAFGGAFIALCSRELGFDKVLAWPSATIGVMGAEQAVKIIFKKELAEAKKPEDFEKQKIKELEKKMSVFEAARLGHIDLILHPKDTRKVLIDFFEMLESKKGEKVIRKHGNIPL